MLGQRINGGQEIGGDSVSKKRKSDGSDTIERILVIIIVIGLLLSMVVLAPGIMIASLFNVIFQLEILALWIITAIVTIIIIGIIYTKVNKSWTGIYLTLAVAAFAVGCIVTYINNDNLFFNTIKDMYPILFSNNG